MKRVDIYQSNLYCPATGIFGVDTTVIFSSLEFLLMVSFLQKDGVFDAQREKAVKKLEESLTFTRFFLDTYVSAYYVDFDTLSWQVYKRADDLEERYPIISDYFASLLDYINHDVHPCVYAEPRGRGQGFILQTFLGRESPRF